MLTGAAKLHGNSNNVIRTRLRDESQVEGALIYDPSLRFIPDIEQE